MLQTIKKGQTNDLVKAVQYMIDTAARGNADGNFSAEFEDAVKKWQSEHNLDADGIIGPKTWTALAAAMPICSTSKHKTSTYTAALQKLLGGMDVDGVFGSQTKKAVAAYQTAKGLDADGIAGPKTWSALVTGESEPAALTVPEQAVSEDLTEIAVQTVSEDQTEIDRQTVSENQTEIDGQAVSDEQPKPAPVVFVQPVDYKQGDSRWGSKMYSNHNDKSQTMRNSACGPTSMADIVATWVDKNITPYDLAQLALSWGDRTYSSGTAWAFFRHAQEHYGFKTMIQTTNLATLKACLENGGYAIASMGPGYWTNGGHFICLWKHDDTYIFANDPASSSRKKQKLTQFVKERKQYFCFYR